MSLYYSILNKKGYPAALVIGSKQYLRQIAEYFKGNRPAQVFREACLYLSDRLPSDFPCHHH